MTLNLNTKIYFIAEAGVNHNGSVKIAKSLILNAKKAGADAIKFQLFNTKNIVTKYADLAPYQRKNNKSRISQYKLISDLEINKKFLREIMSYSKKKKINFMVSVFDEESVDLINSLNYKNFLKIPSGEITNLFLLKKINIKKNKVILSTGMSNYYEICDALNVLTRKKVYEFKNGRIIIKNYQTIKKIQEKIVIMHCVSDYPSKKKYSNLRVINKMKNDFLLRVGFSDHSIGKEIALASVYAGAEFIEKHFTINKKLKGPDHIASLNYLELKSLVKKIKLANLIMGSKTKQIQDCEKKNINIVRKFLVAKKNIFKNQKFTISNLTCKRSAKGISPMNLKKILGKKSKKKYLKDQLIML